MQADTLATAPAWVPDWLAGLPLMNPVTAIRVALLLFLGLPAVLWISRWTRTWVENAATPQRGLVVGKLLWYAGLFTILVTILSELGFSLTPLLGAAGVLGIAVGFASQTSVSNIISGFFLMGEEPFVVGDIIEVGGRTGVVLSIDMMSVKLRTFDNRFVRIPNESLIKSEVVNITRFPIRRLDMQVGVAYGEDLDEVKRVLKEVARKNPVALMEPEPLIIFEGFGESSINFLFAVWAQREKWLELKNSLHQEVKEAFDEAGIEIPFPHRTIYVGAHTDAFPLRNVGSAPEPSAEPGEESAGTPDA